MVIKLQIFIAIFFFSTLSINAQSQLWGMTKYGGQNDAGTIFKTDINGENHIVVYSFSSNNQGALPEGSLIQATNGKLYGMTMSGGSCGVIFEFDSSTETYTKKAEFDNTNGCNPQGSLLQASDGLLYGMTELGGSVNWGTFFKFDITTGIITKILDFQGDNGARPKGNSLIEVSGKLYGMTNTGGTSPGTPGVLFEYNLASNTYNVKYNFNSSNGLGDNPKGSLIKASNGKLYGMTSDGGISNTNGVLFEYDLGTETVSRKFDFNNFDDGLDPKGDLIEISSGIFYGMAPNGGVNSEGVIFEYNLTTNTYTKKFDFDLNNSGAHPQGSLMKSSNGKLYGMTNDGGVNDFGVFFEYDPISGIFTKKLDFDLFNNGGEPVYTQLIEVSSTLGVSENNISNLDIKIYPNPTKDMLNIHSKFPVDNVEVYSVLGKKVLEITNSSSIDLGKLIAGVYFVKIMSNNTFISKRILVK